MSSVVSAVSCMAQELTAVATEVIKLLKEPGTGLGFKIMSGKKKENREGIFVKSIIKGTPAYLDGRMKPC